jgi:hypothetical protein
VQSVNEQIRDAYITHGVELARVQRYIAQMVDEELLRLRDDLSDLLLKMDPTNEMVSKANKQFRLAAYGVRSRQLIKKRLAALAVKVMRELETVGLAEAHFTRDTIQRILNGG